MSWWTVRWRLSTSRTPQTHCCPRQPLTAGPPRYSTCSTRHPRSPASVRSRTPSNSSCSTAASGRESKAPSLPNRNFKCALGCHWSRGTPCKLAWATCSISSWRGAERVKVLVTGASGLIGRHTVELLRGGGYSVRTFQRTLYDGVETVRGDVRTDRAALCAAAADCAAVVHLAGRGDVGESRRDPVGYADLNATGALYALEAARRANAACVLASSQRVYPLHRTPS